MAFYLALDGGGTKTRCWVADDARVLAEVSAGTVKLMNVPEEVATARLRELIHDTLAKAGVGPEQIACSCFGLAGSSSEAVHAWAKRTLAATVSGEVLLCGDEEIALDAAFQGGAGILIIAGTGANVVGRCAQGKLVGAGGWGPMLGDEGSGYWIGLEAIRAGLRAHDRGVDTCLLHEIQSFWKLGSLGDLVALANKRPRPDFAELASLVAECAERGDGLAISVLERAGEELAAQVSLVASKMHASGCVAEDANHVAFAGSVLEKIALVRRSFAEHLHGSLPQSEIAQQAVEPLAGALWRARRG